MKILTLWLTSLLLISAAWAQSHEIPENLREVAYIHHPTAQHYTAGQPTEAELGYFAKAGVRHVLNLRPPQETDEINQAARATRHGLAYYHIPIAGGADLTREHVDVFNTVLERIGDDSALLHCGSSNRVGAMMALHAVWHKGMQQKKAIELGRNYGLTSLESHVREQLNNN